MKDINFSKQDHHDHGLAISPSRITVRPLDLSDTDDYIVWAANEKVTRFLTWESYTNKEDLKIFIKDKIIPHPWFRAICVDDNAIGSISVEANMGNDVCRGKLGYALGHKFWGKGVVTKSVRLVVESVFKDWPDLERLEALVDVENLGSQRVLEKCGFVREGVLRKCFVVKGKTREV